MEPYHVSEQYVLVALSEIKRNLSKCSDYLYEACSIALLRGISGMRHWSVFTKLTSYDIIYSNTCANIIPAKYGKGN